MTKLDACWSVAAVYSLSLGGVGSLWEAPETKLKRYKSDGCKHSGAIKNKTRIRSHRHIMSDPTQVRVREPQDLQPYSLNLKPRSRTAASGEQQATYERLGNELRWVEVRLWGTGKGDAWGTWRKPPATASQTRTLNPKP